MTRTGRWAAVVLCFCALAGGCSSPTVFTLAEGNLRLEPLGPTLVVPLPNDVRPEAELNDMWRCLIPGWSDGHRSMPRPERDSKLDLEAAAVIQKSLMRLASESGLFREVVADRSEVLSPGRLVILETRLSVLSCELERETYRLGFLGSLLWGLGLPSGRMETQLLLQLQFVTPLGEALSSPTIRDSRRRWRGLYFNGNWREAFVDDLVQVLRFQWYRITQSLTPILGVDGP